MYSAAVAKHSDRSEACSEGDRLVLKCSSGRDQRTIVEREAELLQRLQATDLVPKLYEFFTSLEIPDMVCIAMEQLGADLEKIRLGYSEGTTWSWVTLASIGARTIEIVRALHEDYGLVHMDLHPGNFMTTRTTSGSLSPVLKVIDFGEMKDRFHMEAPETYIRDEVRQVVLALLYLFDGNFKFYVWKRYAFDKAEVCANTPEAFCEAIVYVNSIKDTESVDYDRVHRLMVSIIEKNGGKYDGTIIWDPVLQELGTPAVDMWKLSPAANKPENRVYNDFEEISQTTSSASSTVGQFKIVLNDKEFISMSGLLKTVSLIVLAGLVL